MDPDLPNKLRGLVTNITWSPEEATQLFVALLKRFDSTRNDRSQLLPWMLRMLHCIEINYITPSWRWKTEKTLSQLVGDDTVTDENLMKYLADDTEKTLDEIIEEIRQQKSNQTDEKLLADVKDIVSSVHEGAAPRRDGSQQADLINVLQKLCQVCQADEEIHFRPRLTQMVSWCIMALSKTGRLLQVGTGEGKSCIVAMFAAFRALRGEKVDIMSSSPVLAERDFDEWQNFYEALKIRVSCNVNKTTADSKACYQCQVVYGTVEEFCGDWLRHYFHRMDIFGQRTFQCAIVDEVDSLMLDKGLHTVYLSSKMPALQHVNPLLAFIWATVNQYSKVGPITLGQKLSFLHVVLENVPKSQEVNELTVLQMAEDAGILTKGSVGILRKDMDRLTEKTASVNAAQLAEFFKVVEKRFPSCQFALHCKSNHGSITELNQGLHDGMDERQRVPLLLSSGGCCQYMFLDQDSVQRAVEKETQHVLRFTPCEPSQEKGCCYVPAFLSDLVKSKLNVWIENAFYAQTITMDHQYIVEGHGVVPVDYSCTGVVENHMKWTDGLQQFIEMKHGSKLSDMTAITNYMSHVGLLQKYGDQIFGITGTLGQQAETETLQETYEGIKTCQIPSFKRRKLFEVEGVIADDEEEWLENICSVITAQANKTSYRAQRAVLVICETIGRAKDLDLALGDEVQKKMLYISNNKDNTAIFAKKLEGGDVIIATNLAGRGTNIQVSEPVKEAGGMYVVQTFLPKNARVEAQAFGRTARQGSPGSAQLIVCSKHLPLSLQLLVQLEKLASLRLGDVIDLQGLTSLYPDIFVMQLLLHQRHSNDQTEDLSSTLSQILSNISKSQMESIKQIRDDSVARGLASYLESDIPQIKKKADLFCQYLDVLDEVYKSSNNQPADTYLSALNEVWGMWLLTTFNNDRLITDLKEQLTADLEEARKKLEHGESPLSNLHHYTAFGNALRKEDRLPESIDMYTKAMEEDHCQAAVAYYNCAFASLMQENGRQDPKSINEALGDLQNALKSVELYCEQINLTRRYSTQQLLTADTRLDGHLMVRQRVFTFFKENINEAIKKVGRARDLGGKVKVQESLVYFQHLLPSLLLTAALSQSRRDPLQILQIQSSCFFDIFHELIGLESLGLTHVFTVDTLISPDGFFTKIHRIMSRAFD